MSEITAATIARLREIYQLKTRISQERRENARLVRALEAARDALAGEIKSINNGYGTSAGDLNKIRTAINATLQPAPKGPPQREKFEQVEWKIGKDSYPENPEADPKCATCKGHGVIDTGEQYGCILANCPHCWNQPKGPSTERTCFECGDPIYESMGTCNAGDVENRLQDGTTPVREWCAMCATKRANKPAGGIWPADAEWGDHPKKPSAEQIHTYTDSKGVHVWKGPSAEASERADGDEGGGA